MYGGSSLPLTGASALVFGHAFGLDMIIAVGLSLVVCGIIVFRFSMRLRDRVSSP